MKKPKHDLARITKATERNPTLSADRMAVETLLRTVKTRLTPATIAKRTKLASATVTVILQRLRHDGIAVNAGTQKLPLWQLCQPKTLSSQPERVCNSMSGGTYKALELRPFSGRPGAMDAFSLPSRGIKA